MIRRSSLIALVGLLCACAVRAQEADKKTIDAILQEIEMAPCLYARLDASSKPELPRFVAAKLLAYQLADNDSVEQNRKRWSADKPGYAKNFPMRAALFEAVEESENLRSLKVPVTLPLVKGPLIEKKQKKGVLDIQGSLAVSIFKLEQAYKKTDDVSDWRDKQKLPRWKADFDFAQARMQTNLLFLYECDYTFGQVRADTLPKLATNEASWKIVLRPKLNVTEPKAKSLAKARLKLLNQIQKEHAETPWAFFAERESKRDLGMEWMGKKK
jgi:hypothetical protein